MSLEIRETQDGSHTLYITELDEHYHSYHGAIQEALHVFINNGLNPLLKAKQLNILEGRVGHWIKQSAHMSLC